MRRDTGPAAGYVPVVRLAMRQELDVVVIGGGVIGISCAYFLNQRGRQVTVLEKGEICSGSSYGNAGLIVPSHSIPLAAPGVMAQGLKWMFDPQSPFYIKPRLNLDLLAWLWRFRGACNRRQMNKAMAVIRDLSLASLRLYEQLADLNGLDFAFQKRGMLLLYKTDETLREGTEEAHQLEGIGLETRILNHQDLADLEPNVRINANGGVYFPQDAQIIPARFVQQLASYVQAKGVEVRTQTEVIGLEMRSGRIVTVRTTRGDLAPRQVVLAGGSWSPGIARDLPLELPIQPAKGYSITVKRPARSPQIPLMLHAAKVGITPMGDTLRFAGTLELAGMDLSINTRRVQAILNAVPQFLPDLDPAGLELIEIWRGLRPCTPDGLPCIGRTRTCANLTVAAGHAMIGMSLGPITGKLVSDVVIGEKPDIDLRLLAVDRFG